MFSFVVRRLLSHQARKSFQRTITTTVPKCSGEPAWVYRGPSVPAPRIVERAADTLGILMWYWIIYHVITQYDHITGEFPYPEPSKWTDEELGIPKSIEE